ncbi:MAG TPA: response regulator [Myxococcales bacterium]|nr:response regulator [Myxococcales bacterium]
MPGSPSALVVEDDPEIRKLLRKYLEKLGFSVEEAATGKSALAMLETVEVPNIVCLDLMLPDSSGYTICERIRALPRLSEVPVLIISARSMPPDRALAEEVGATAYLIKPIRWASFSEVVLGLTGKS